MWAEVYIINKLSGKASQGVFEGTSQGHVWGGSCKRGGQSGMLRGQQEASARGAA